MTKFEKSFYEWCIENNHEDYLELWDYELNECNPKNIAYSSKKKYWFKCSRGIHPSKEKSISTLTIQNILIKCKQCNSIGQYLIDTYGENALALYWDYEKNKVNPFEVAKNSHTKVWIKCQEKDYHESYEIRCCHCFTGHKCPYCRGLQIHKMDSFGQLLLDEYGTLDIIWDFEKNRDLDPFKVSKCSGKKVWLFCQEKEYHGSYEAKCSNYYNGSRCPYCFCKHGKVHPKDSFAQYHIDNTDADFLEKYWSNKNTIDPFILAPNTNKIKIWINCLNDEKHKDYKTTCNSFTRGSRCPKCKESKGEKKIRKYLNANDINFIPQKEFSDLVGTSEWKPLSYDFYIPDCNLLVEYQGNYHDGTASNQSKERLLNQQEHDRRKREYAEQNGIRLLEIWYWDFDNIETILNENIK